MVGTINNIDKNFHESFSAKGFRYLNAVGDTAPGPIVDASTLPPTTSRCPPGYEWAMGRCNLQVANPNSGGSKPPAPAPPPPTPKPAPPPGPGGTPVPIPPPVPPFPTPTPTTHPPAGTLLGSYCAGVDKMGRYADGVGGYSAAVIERNSSSCGYVAPGPVPAPAPGPAPAPLPSSGPVYPSIPGGGGGAPGGGAGYEEPMEYMEETVAVLPAEEINWPAIAIAGAMVGLTYWYMGKEKAVA